MEKRLEIVDALRGLAALSVAWFHLTNQTFPQAGSLGWLGVDVFFVISGFVVPLSLFGKDYRVSGFWRFLARRLVRLEPPYIVSIAIVLVLAWASALAPGFRGQPIDYTPTQVASHLLYLAPLFDQSWIQPVYWSLAYELVFYICVGLLFPLLIHRPIFWVAPVALLGLLPHFLLTQAFTPLVLEFTIGFAAMRYFVRRDSLAIFLVTLIILAAIIAASGAPWRAVASTAAALAIAFLKTPRWRPAAFFGALSYSLYLVHVPIGGRVVNLGLRFVEAPMEKLALSVLAMAVSIVTAYAFYRLIEQPALRWSKKIAPR